ncbi:dipicolinate synthase subunit B [Pullulanibacillus pueri]|uniref:Dipicolinate synthase subunit B n=1 Tax=Pullulanibacillus pueri TaxID=1437324 RepID=A0A8J2ZVQ9_9BACL|nr:dipicolinate synthase subunit B [Pullulanibacillus pueri]MBM7682528.1 dipicolinate synthase subunit B [Pullulanibacillus pueri]GGH82041.1 dipicolinate synthase subunit B [Pullulanibacillus pueri]
MDFKGKHIGFGMTGSHCTYSQVVPQIERLVELGANVTPFVTYTVKNTNTRFGDGQEWVNKLEEVTGNKVIDSVVEAEPFGPNSPMDCMIIAPLTGNSLSKFANATTDSAVLMAAKATLRNESPVVLGISTNDGLGLSMANIAKLMVAKNVFFIPFGQDDPVKKKTSLVSRMEAIPETVEAALQKKQIQPVLIEKFRD